MTPKNKLFIGILAFMLIVNILVIFDINQFYIRAILGFVFLITIPGLLIMLCLKIRNINFWEYLVYTIGLSVAFIMFAGLAVNWILPFLNITDKPLSLYPILICFDTILLGLWLVAHKRNEDNVHLLIFPFDEYEKKRGKFNFIPRLTSLSWFDRIFIIIPFCFPFMAVIGAFLLNNHGTNIVTLIMLGAIAIYVLLVVIFRDKLNENVFPWALWMIGLSLLLTTSMRGWGIPNHDIIYEFNIFKITKNNSLWNVGDLQGAYGACLSLSILPQIIDLFTKFSGEFIFKFIMILLFPSIMIIVFKLSGIILKKKIYSFLSSLFIITSTVFIIEIPMEIRQSIALIFFGLMLLVLFSKEINPILKKTLFVIFGFSMIVSHYSTAYIAFALFLLTYILAFLYKKLENRKIKKGKVRLEEKQEFYLTFGIILLIFVFGFLWYSQLTPASNGIISTISKTFTNLNNLFSNELKQPDTNLARQINIFYKFEDPTKTVRSYEEWVNSINNSEYGDIKQNIRWVPPSLIKPKISYSLSQEVFLISSIIEKILRFSIAFGLLFCLIYRKRENFMEYLIMSLIFLLFLVAILILPVISASYSSARLYIQTLIILSPFSLFGLDRILNKIRIGHRELIIAILLIIYFLLITGWIFQIIGGYYPEYNLSNAGDIYEKKNFVRSNFISANWILSEEGKLNADASSKVLLSLSGYNYNSLSDDVSPSSIGRKSWVYSSYTNKIFGRAFKIFENRGISFNFPTEFLNDNKNKIYNNGGSEIFK